MVDINHSEQFIKPDSMNSQVCKYIAYGETSIGDVLTNNEAVCQSMLHQLDKLESQNRRFVYYVS